MVQIGLGGAFPPVQAILCVLLCCSSDPQGSPDIIPLCASMQNCQNLLSWVCPTLRGQALLTEIMEFMSL